MYTITVRDTFCGIRGEYVEEQNVHTKSEADMWAKEWRSMYAKEDGYAVKIKFEA